MIEREVPGYPTSFRLDRGCHNQPLWKVTVHVCGAVKEIGRVEGDW